MRAAIYARVSTAGQEPENQLQELRRYTAARGWDAKEFIDHISGAKERRPALDAMMADARRRRIDAIVCWRLDRLGRSLRHLVGRLEEIHGLGVAFVSLGEGLDCTTPAGRLQMHLLAAISEFERGRLRERVLAGLAHARAQGKRLGRPKASIPMDKLIAVKSMSNAEAAEALEVSLATIKRWRAAQKTLTTAA